jgi:GMP synthase (glutamine-hydrolysing)
MRTALAIRHVAFEDLGTFAGPLQAAGYAVTYLEAGVGPYDQEPLATADLLIVLGGPIGVYETAAYPWLADEIAAVQRRLAAGRPTLGLCLGAQVMAAALGARVYPGEQGKEIGWAPVELTEAGGAGPLAALDGVAVLHWHGDTFDLPPGATRLAGTERYPNQAFAIGRSLGLQFHPEVEAAMFERWLIGHAVEIAAAPGIDVPVLRGGAVAHGARLRAAGAEVVARWLAEVA